MSSLFDFGRAFFGPAGPLARPSAITPGVAPRAGVAETLVPAAETRRDAGLAAAVDQQVALLKPRVRPMPLKPIDLGALISAEFAPAPGDDRAVGLRKAIGRSLALECGPQKAREYAERLEEGPRSQVWPEVGASSVRGVLSAVPRR